MFEVDQIVTYSGNIAKNYNKPCIIVHVCPCGTKNCDIVECAHQHVLLAGKYRKHNSYGPICSNRLKKLKKDAPVDNIVTSWIE